LEGAALEELWHKTAAIADLMAEANAGPQTPFVFSVEKSTRNAFAMGITIGRVASNDVVIDHPSVSRFHAWLTKDDAGQWRIFDADSQNGTWLGSVRATSKQGLVVVDNNSVRVGHTRLTFLLPQTLEAKVRAFPTEA
jgi:pSer/pThr/pTyr-binding forkhead associated (FHA) protein